MAAVCRLNGVTSMIALELTRDNRSDKEIGPVLNSVLVGSLRMRELVAVCCSHGSDRSAILRVFRLSSKFVVVSSLQGTF